VRPLSELEARLRVAERVAELRSAKKWTQKTLAERSKLPRTYIADLEGARRNPSLRTLVRVANALGVPLHDLFELKL
jgi:transcriptional regulator with XRE-family HTH domain